MMDQVSEAANAASAARNAQLRAILIENRFVPNDYILELNGGLQSLEPDRRGDPWNLPSRMFGFPLEVNEDCFGRLRIGVLHSLLFRHPFVEKVAAAVKPVRIRRNGAPNAAGYTNVEAALWWHAVDLIPRWKDLLRTIQFTTPNHIIRAVSFGLTYQKIDTPAARLILGTLGTIPSAVVRRGDGLSLFMEPLECKPDKGAAYWPINLTRQAHEDVINTAWAYVIGLETGWFAYDRKGYLHWSARGRDLWFKRNSQLELPL